MTTVRNHSKLVTLIVLAVVVSAGCGRRKTGKLGGGLEGQVEPDRVLYARALEDIQKGKHIAARLNLMTLINTYPDSEFLAKAKLGVADSYYKEGGTSGLTMAVQEYKDFITFFPFLPEAAYAQHQVGMCHYRRLEKPDRDRTQARLAEAEFQEFLRKYPGDQKYAEAEQRLREVQEVLAEGDYRIARHYYIKGSYRAAGGRLIELTDRYPLYSNADKALLMLGDVFEKSEKGDIAARFFGRIVRDYPLSPLVEEAKARLENLGVPLPQPDPAALERMQREAELREQQGGTALWKRPLEMLSTRPDVSRAARTGSPNMEPPSESSPTLESLRPQGTFDVVASQASGSSGGRAAGTPGEGSTTAGNSPAGENPASATPSSNAPTTALDLPQRAESKKKKKDDKKKKSKEEEQESSSKKKP